MAVSNYQRVTHLLFCRFGAPKFPKSQHIPNPRSLKAIDSMTHVDPAACVVGQLLNGRLGSHRKMPIDS